MADNNVRFTAWLSQAERDALDAAAREQHTSINYILRLIVRAAFGLDKGERER